jgi:Protein of unknown function (DUF2800)
MTNEHSKLPPSNAARRMACPGSRAMEERYGRNEKTEASTEGDLAHELAAFYLTKGLYGLINIYTEEMHEGAKLYVDTVKRFLTNPEMIQIEEKIHIKNIHPECWGTPDAWGICNSIAYGAEQLALHVFDYKFGFTPVDAYENWQLLEYACGIIDYSCSVTDIYFHIIQPRDYISSSKHKVWHLPIGELRKYRHKLKAAEALAMTPNAEIKVSEQCKYCTARHACPALQEASLQATQVAFRDVPQALDPNHMGNELKLLHQAQELLEYRIAALETEVTHHLTAGTPIDHYELTPKYGNLNWSVDKKEVLTLGDVLGINLRKEDIITPTQAIKLGMDETVVKGYSERKQGLKLSKIDLTKSKEVFKK